MSDLTWYISAKVSDKMLRLERESPSRYTQYVKQWSEYLKTICSRYGIKDPMSVFGISDLNDLQQVGRYIFIVCQLLTDSECRVFIDWLVRHQSMVKECLLAHEGIESKFLKLDEYGEALVMLPENILEIIKKNPEAKFVQIPILLVHRHYIRFVILDCYYGLIFRDTRAYERFEEIEKLGVTVYPVGKQYVTFRLYEKGNPSDIVYKIYNHNIYYVYACLFYRFVRVR